MFRTSVVHATYQCMGIKIFLGLPPRVKLRKERVAVSDHTHAAPPPRPVREVSLPRVASPSRAVPTSASLRSRALSTRALSTRALSTSSRTRGAVTASASSATASPSSGDGDAKDFKDWLETFRKAKWDEAPKSWREFMATKVAAAVVEVDVANDRVNAKEVEGIGLNVPKDGAEAKERVKSNLIYYRQNYAIVVASYVAIAQLFVNPAMTLCVLFLGAAAACASDTLLGELALASKDKLKWNAKVVAGVDRTQARQALLVIAGIGALTSLKYSWGYLIMNVVYGIALSLTHAILRPIDLKSTLSNLWRDVKNVATKEEAAAAAKKAVKGMKSWWSNRRPNEPTPVVVAVKDDPMNPGGFQDAARNAARRQREQRERENDGAVDADGWTKADSRGELPPPSKR